MALDFGEIIFGDGEIGVDGVQPLDVQQRAVIRGDDVSNIDEPVPRARTAGRGAGGLVCRSET